MTNQNTEQKRIQITTNVQSNRSSLYERIVDNHSGESTIARSSEPTKISSKSVLTTHPDDSNDLDEEIRVNDKLVEVTQNGKTYTIDGDEGKKVERVKGKRQFDTSEL